MGKGIVLALIAEGDSITIDKITYRALTRSR